ncbi:PREDICTED: pre-mRNA-processing protein 40A-like isoform X2 [Populus euphratica]|uniref:Pre-mRNA-processing protein 40A-like isoform X2 n=1 Tax=Populus euphratica TaxID=75702 RepID=A0AAJ6X1I5_POPEU|nr:PREDICTED: pre-mRNA-processing protein 40A-like isoform X2 [Populus euphratica]
MANNPQFSGIQPLQPPLVGSMDPPRNLFPPPPMPVQFRPIVPVQPQQFIPASSPHFQPVGRGVTVMNAGLPPQPPQPQFPHSMQQLPAIPNRPSHGPPPPPPPPPQAILLPNAQPNRHVMSGSPLPPHSVQTPNNYMPSLGGLGVPLSSSYNFAPSSHGQPPITFNAVSQYQPMPQMHAPSIPSGGQPALPSTNQNTALVSPIQHNGEQSSITTASVLATGIQPRPTEEALTEWKEHASANGRRFYYNKRTKQSSWEKPFELMTPIERADASTDWKEFTSPDGRKYYYNKVTKQSKWEIPEELKLARAQVEKPSIMETQLNVSANSHAPTSVLPSMGKAPSSADALSSTAQGAPSSPVPVKPVAVAGNSQSQFASESSAVPVMSSSMTTNADEVQTTESPVAGVPKNAEINATAVNTITAPMSDSFSAHDKPGSKDDAPAQDKQEAEKDVVIDEKVNNVTLEEKSVNQDPLLYADKLEEKNAFKALLESANVGSEWTWDQAMRVIINDKRYGALKTLGERKQAFNEFLGQKRKQEAEERRVKQKKAREEFKKMLEGSKELTASMRWSKVATLFENDERFKAVERERDRRDLIETYLQEIEEKERAKAHEERKRNIMEYRQFLESCEFIKASTQWRKVQDRLEADERCSRLEKIYRLEIFQDYLHDLVKEEEEQRKIQKEEQRKAERKNRDEFRKLLEEHVASGTLTAKTNWRDYHLKVKDLPAYVAVASNASGSTPKDLFEDVSEELQKQYHEDKTRIKDVVKLKKVTLASNWTLQDMKVAIIEDVNSPPISDVNLKMVFDELLERAREKEEKEAKKRKRLADDFLNLLQSIKDITASSKWESFKEIFEGSQEYSSIGEEAFCREMFEEYISQLKEQQKENERKRKEEKAKKEKERDERDRRKAKHRSEKERGHERDKEHTRKEEADVEISDTTETQVCSDKKRSGSDNSSRKQRKRHQNAVDDLDESEKDRSKSSHRHGSNDHKKSRRHGSTPESDSESRHKRLKKDHRNGSRRAGDNEDLEDGEFGSPITFDL